jgi:hypothetical protein
VSGCERRRLRQNKKAPDGVRKTKTHAIEAKQKTPDGVRKQ